MPASVERFVQGYVDAFNRSLGESVDGDTYEIFAFVAGDEMALYRKHGLVPETT